MRVSILLLATLAALLACESDPTAPPTTGEIRIAHAAGAGGTFSVAVDGEALTPSLELGGVLEDSVTHGNHTVEFRTGDHETAMPIRTFGPLMGVVLMGADAALPRVYPHNRRSVSGASIRIINAVPDRRLTTHLSGDGATLAATLDYTDAATIGVPGGTYAVTVSEGDPEEEQQLGSVMIPNGRVFVVIHPDTDGSLRGLVF